MEQKILKYWWVIVLVLLISIYIIMKRKSMITGKKIDVSLLSTSENGKNIIIKHESSGNKYKYNKPYKDPVGLWTVGVGHLLLSNEMHLIGKKLSNSEIDALFDKDIKIAENIVKKYIKVPLTQNQFDALVSFAFNFGETKFKGYAIVAMINNSVKPDIIAAKFLEYSKGRVNGILTTLKGLLSRRQDESKLYLS